jgi:hypothetical protein
MLVLLTYRTPKIEVLLPAHNYTTCLLDINMERLRVVNPTVYEWIRTIDVIVDFDKEVDERMYKAIVNDARNGITGCIKVVKYKQIEVCAKVTRGLSDVAMMRAASYD